jgi:Mlc titration factor MtfA (ptsG expression regulator)
MNPAITSVADLKKFLEQQIERKRMLLFVMMGAIMIFCLILATYSGQIYFYGVGILVSMALFVLHLYFHQIAYRKVAIFDQQFPETWRGILQQRVLFYSKLPHLKKALFEKRVQVFLASKKIVGVKTVLDDETRILVAASAIIPTFAFPAFDYPELTEILIYPTAFTQNFDFESTDNQSRNLIGMVGNGYMNHVMLLSKDALFAGFDGRLSKYNVGVHEFVHLLDQEDGIIDGIPERLMEHKYVIPWLHLIKKEMDKIKEGESEIHPYAITNNAEFLTVISEYFFNNPEDFYYQHPDLYAFLTKCYRQNLIFPVLCPL